jgi:hypothetical protein
MLQASARSLSLFTRMYKVLTLRAVGGGGGGGGEKGGEWFGGAGGEKGIELLGWPSGLMR